MAKTIAAAAIGKYSDVITISETLYWAPNIYYTI